MTKALPPSDAAARWSLRLVLVAGFGLMLWLNLPGHLTVDSVLALHEGRFGVRETWNPAIFGWLLGVLDRISPGTALVVGLSGLLLFGSWAALVSLRPRTSWLAPVLALGVVALPQAMIYPAIVWKDVLFAGFAVAGFVVLAFAVRAGREQTSWGRLAIAALLFAVAGLLRQNGLVLAAPAALALAWARSPAGWGRSLRLAGLWLAAVAASAFTLSAVAQPEGVGAPDRAGAKGLRILQTYDLTAAAALEPDRPMPALERANPRAAAYLRAQASRIYSPERVDTLNADRQFAEMLRPVPSEVIGADWLGLIAHDTGTYLRVRLRDFAQVFATPVIDRCLPLTVGVEGPTPALADLRMPPRKTLGDQRLWNYATWFFDTPAMSHVPYAIAALLVGGLLLFRRDPADLIMAGFMAGALAFTASFFVLSLACDYRYLYLLDVAALTGVLYVAIDPRLSRI